MVKLCYSSQSAPKEGVAPEEMEDAHWPSFPHATPNPGDGSPSPPGGVPLEHPLQRPFYCAVADGATQGSHSGPWALALCQAFVAQGDTFPHRDLDISLSPWLRSLWLTAKTAFDLWEKTYLHDRAAKGRQLAWFEEAVMQTGSFSTLLGLAISPPTDEGLLLHAVAMGDSCLFLLRQNQIDRSFPLVHSDQFKNSPYLIATDPQKNDRLKGATSLYQETLQVGDSLFMCTDALSAWIMRQREQNNDPSERLLALAEGPPQEFHSFLREERSLHRMRNDDVTLVHVKVQV